MLSSATLSLNYLHLKAFFKNILRKNINTRNDLQFS